MAKDLIFKLKACRIIAFDFFGASHEIYFYIDFCANI